MRADDEASSTAASSSESKAESKSEQDMRIDMDLVEKAERQPPDNYERLERQLLEECVVIFELPDGSEGEKSFKIGQTVQVLKSFVEDEYDIPMAAQKLYLGDQLMLDPLTLGDYPTIRPSRSVIVRVDGDLPPSAGKK